MDLCHLCRACQALSCTRRSFRVGVRREEHCPHRWQREAAEDRARTAKEAG